MTQSRDDVISEENAGTAPSENRITKKHSISLETKHETFQSDNTKIVSVDKNKRAYQDPTTGKFKKAPSLASIKEQAPKKEISNKQSSTQGIRYEKGNVKVKGNLALNPANVDLKAEAKHNLYKKNLGVMKVQVDSVNTHAQLSINESGVNVGAQINGPSITIKTAENTPNNFCVGNNLVEVNAEASVGVGLGLKVKGSYGKNKSNNKKNLTVTTGIGGGVRLAGKLSVDISENHPKCVQQTSPNTTLTNADESFKSAQALTDSQSENKKSLLTNQHAFFSENSEKASSPSTKNNSFMDTVCVADQAVYLEVNADRSRVRLNCQDLQSQTFRTEELSVVDFVPQFNQYLKKSLSQSNSQERLYLAGLVQELNLLGLPGITPFSNDIPDRNYFRSIVEQRIGQTENIIKTGNANSQHLTLFKSSNTEKFRAQMAAKLQLKDQQNLLNETPFNKLDPQRKCNYPEKPADLTFGNHSNFVRPKTPPPIRRPEPNPLQFSKGQVNVDFTPHVQSGGGGGRNNKWQAVAGVSFVIVRFSIQLGSCLIM